MIFKKWILVSPLETEFLLIRGVRWCKHRARLRWGRHVTTQQRKGHSWWEPWWPLWSLACTSRSWAEDLWSTCFGGRWRWGFLRSSRGIDRRSLSWGLEALSTKASSCLFATVGVARKDQRKDAATSREDFEPMYEPLFGSPEMGQPSLLARAQVDRRACSIGLGSSCPSRWTPAQQPVIHGRPSLQQETSSMKWPIGFLRTSVWSPETTNPWGSSVPGDCCFLGIFSSRGLLCLGNF